MSQQNKQEICATYLVTDKSGSHSNSSIIQLGETNKVEIIAIIE